MMAFCFLASLQKVKGVREVHMRRNQLKFSATENETADDAMTMSTIGRNQQHKQHSQ